MLYNKFKCPDIVTVIKVRRLEWLGRVVRMKGEGTVQRLLEGEPEGERKREKDLDSGGWVLLKEKNRCEKVEKSSG